MARNYHFRSTENIRNTIDALWRHCQENSVDGTPDLFAENSTNARDMTGGAAVPGFPVTVAQNCSVNYDWKPVTNQEGASSLGANFLGSTIVVFPFTACRHYIVPVRNLRNFCLMEVRRSQAPTGVLQRCFI